MTSESPEIPFFANDGDGKQCLQCCMRTAINHFLKKDMTLEELDLLTHRSPDKWTWTVQMTAALHTLGLDVRLYSKEPLEPLLGGIEHIRNHFGKHSEKIISNMDVDVTIAAAKEVLEAGIFEEQVPSMDELAAWTRQGYLIVALLDWNKVLGKNDLYQGHAVVITQIDNDYVFVHDSGPTKPTPHRKLARQTFIDAWNAEGTDNDLVVVRGVRKQDKVL